MVGILTSSKLQYLLDEGDVDQGAVDTFYDGVRAFYHGTVKYALQKLPISDGVVKNAKFLNFALRLDSNINEVNYFVKR